MPNSIPQGYNVFFDIIQQIQDEGVDLPFQDTLNFIGAGVTASDDAGNGRTNVDIPGMLDHDLLDGNFHPDTVANTPTRGSIIYGNSTPLWDELLKGNAGEFLKSTSMDIVWDKIDRTDIDDYIHQLLDSTAHSDTVTQAVTAGSLVFGNATPLWDELTIGTAGQVLTVSGGFPVWADPTGASPLTTKGDLFTYDTGDARLPVGADNSILIADSAEATGLKWIPKDISCRIRKTAVQSIPHTGIHIIDWDSEDYDTDSMHDNVTNNSRITIKTAGKYHILAQSDWENNSSGQRFLAINLNGPARLAAVRNDAVGQSEDQVSFVGEFAVNDYIELVVFQSSGGALDFDNAETFMEAHKID